MSLMLAHEKKRFLFEIRPDIIPQGFLTDMEMELWGYFYDELIRQKNG